MLGKKNTKANFLTILKLENILAFRCEARFLLSNEFFIDSLR